jgi:hypothetical protein
MSQSKSDIEKAFALLKQYTDDVNADERVAVGIGKLLLMVYKEFKTMITDLNNTQMAFNRQFSSLENRIHRLEEKQRAEEFKKARDRNNNNTLNLD